MRVQAQEDAYKKDFGAFEKQFRDTAAAFAAAMDAGFSSTTIELQYHQQLMQLQTEEDPQFATDATSSKPKGTVALQSSFNNNSQKLVNWLLASDPHRKDNLCSSAANALEVRTSTPMSAAFVRAAGTNNRAVRQPSCCAGSAGDPGA